MAANHTRPFDVRAFLDSPDVEKQTRDYGRTEDVFLQGDACNTVMFIQKGGVKLSVRSKTGREVVVAMLGPGEFFGEGCMSGQPHRMGSATALTPSTIVVLKSQEMLRLLREQPGLAHGFITHLLSANTRIQQDLVDQLSNHAERRLARTLLLLAHYGGQDAPEPVLPRITQTALAKMAGTTRSKVAFFMKKFKRLGFLEAGRVIKINSALLSVVLRE